VRPHPWTVRLTALLSAFVLLVGISTAVSTPPVLSDRATRTTLPPPAPEPHFPATTRFYVDPDTPAAQWVRDHARDARASVVQQRIASRPTASWFADPDPLATQDQVRAVVDAAEARGAVPVLVPYAVHRRDRSGHSAGGTGDIAAYRNWIAAFARGIGPRDALVVLEPDALALLDCLRPRERQERFSALSHAGRTLRHDAPHARVYYDAGNSGWHPARTMGERLTRAGATRYGDGIALNVSNFRTTDDEIRYGHSVLDVLDDARLGMVIDTGRSGAGPARGHRPCDPPGRRLGHMPTVKTGVSRVDAYLWVKPPGEADGCAAAAGVFDPRYATSLIE
jgi:endoglucanase